MQSMKEALVSSGVTKVKLPKAKVKKMAESEAVKPKPQPKAKAAGTSKMTKQMARVGHVKSNMPPIIPDVGRPLDADVARLIAKRFGTHHVTP